MSYDLYSKIKSGNTLEIQKEFARILKDKLVERVKAFMVNEENGSEEQKASLEIETAAKSHGGGNYLYKDGVAIVTLRNKQASSEFSNWLESNDFVETYEMNVIHHEADKDVKDDVNFDDITDDRNFSFEFIIYLVPDIVVYDVDSDEEDSNDEDSDEEMESESEDLSEAKRKIKMNFMGQKRVKMVCQPGFKWDANENVCSKISGEELIDIRRGIRKALMTKKAEGDSLKKRIIRKTKKAMKYRKIYGLGV